VEPVAVGLPGAQFTVKNSRLSGVVRPLTFSVKDAEGGDVKAAVEAKMGRMFGNAAAYSVEVAGWRDSSGALWAPNTTVTILAPGAMIYKEFEFIVRSVTLQAAAESRTAVLDLVIPGAFSGKVPEVLPWDG
jgi:prophage tail gpP-like protein